MHDDIFQQRPQKRGVFRIIHRREICSRNTVSDTQEAKDNNYAALAIMRCITVTNVQLSQTE